MKTSTPARQRKFFRSFPRSSHPNLRRQAKIINFGIIYGMSPFGLSKALGISRKMAQTYINNYFTRYKGVKAFIDRTIAHAHETHQTSTLLGRIRLLPDLASTNQNDPAGRRKDRDQYTHSRHGCRSHQSGDDQHGPCAES